MFKDDENFVRMAAQIVDSYVRFNRIAATDVPTAIQSVHSTLAKLASGTQDVGDVRPAVSIKKSLGDDFIICLEDGKKLTMLKRYLMAQFGMTPEEYRRKWNLPADYPMVAPAYARLRSSFAKKNGLGKIPTHVGARKRAG